MLATRRVGDALGHSVMSAYVSAADFAESINLGQLLDPACVKRRRLRLAVEVGNDEAILCPDCLHQTTNAQNADYPFHIVGQDV
jgi:hypothetical protein